MITYFIRIACAWYKVTTSLAKWARLPHVVGTIGCAVVLGTIPFLHPPPPAAQSRVPVVQPFVPWYPAPAVPSGFIPWYYPPADLTFIPYPVIDPGEFLSGQPDLPIEIITLPALTEPTEPVTRPSQPVPEPGSLLLVGAAAVALVRACRCRPRRTIDCVRNHAGSAR
jgi:hypothetical protein